MAKSKDNASPGFLTPKPAVKKANKKIMVAIVTAITALALPEASNSVDADGDGYIDTPAVSYTPSGPNAYDPAAGSGQGAIFHSV
jgi:hypothetical protein